MNYNSPMFEIIQSDEFMQWAAKLKDRRAEARIAARLRRAEEGNLGDHKPLRDGVSEMRIDVGAGYRLYFTRRGNTVLVLLCGGDKRTQEADIKRAIALARAWKE
ncbi:MAG: type II toxin-antitoxin system RelE/ParE family toxin [Candidatus Accumulibacter sp.]|nr:type II toxin-antitoxin system RelE/ParE family toxin [Accumulibacter sp.]